MSISLLLSAYALNLTTFAAILALGFRFIIYPIFFSPLSKVPVAHPLSHVTSLWIQWHRWQGTEFDRISKAFAHKGPYIRIGPSEIVVNTVEAVQSVYGVGANNFDKHPSYDYFITQGVIHQKKPNLTDERKAATGDTFGTMVTYMIYEISRHKGIQEQLRKELLLATNTPKLSSQPLSSIPPSNRLERLVLLNCVIMESLRLRNNAPNLDPRLAPAHGRSEVGALSNVPPGVRIGTYGWLLNRNPEVFPEPEQWQPNRWKSGGPKAAALRNQWLFAFGGGSRGCVGQQVAMEFADEAGYPGANKFVGSNCRERLFIKFEKLARSVGDV
ncbi:cytochrome p450 domain-containing protein [Hirsutella rhossiliensis]|uniref:Cytochrome p450 domain-containing protein n=1 Tax=Hirsutella rhossiliensis TaxID=111463 RepID=A0A9P8N283_9HYPO|nr:cytochrome p450 domain-containing protein [Hirsutella rhossiliensis]KAH0964586.1 cytochrome p450 domain-containing protein [Hirsutella rhossiliensis]